MSTKKLYEILKTVTSEKEFDKQLIKYFNKHRFEDLTNEIQNNLTQQEKKLFQQILNSYYSKNYSLASIELLTIIDNCLSYYLINKGCTYKLNIFKPIIDDLKKNDDGTNLIFILMMIDNNINRLYEKIEFIEIKL